MPICFLRQGDSTFLTLKASYSIKVRNEKDISKAIGQRHCNEDYLC